MKYLNKNYSTLEELKKHYKEWSKKLHPDVGGTDAEMQELNNELDYILSNNLFNAKSTDENFDYTAYSSLLSSIIKSVSHLENCTIEIIGVWVWITGNTFPYRAHLKSNGFLYSSSKKAWYYPTTGYSKRKSKNSMNTLRQMWGSETVKSPSKSANPASLKA